jgi:hypothetical protein
MSDIVEQLRAAKVETPYGSGNTLLHLLAADEITRLRAALAAQQPPPGWRMVPDFAHPAMQALADILDTNTAQITELQRRLAAAPQPGIINND